MDDYDHHYNKDCDYMVTIIVINIDPRAKKIYTHGRTDLATGEVMMAMDTECRSLMITLMIKC